MIDPVWRPLRRPHLGMADSISEIFYAEEWRTPRFFTDVRSSAILFLASDYGGEHRTAAYQTISILVAAFDSIQVSWEPLRRSIRSLFAGDGRRLSYKRLGDRQRAKMLRPFLGAANHIQGILAIFLIDRRIRTFFQQDANPEEEGVIAMENRYARKASSCFPFWFVTHRRIVARTSECPLDI